MKSRKLVNKPVSLKRRIELERQWKGLCRLCNNPIAKGKFLCSAHLGVPNIVDVVKERPKTRRSVPTQHVGKRTRLGSEIHRLSSQRRIEKQVLAKLMNMSRSGLSALLGGQKALTETMAIALESAFGKPVDHWMRLERISRAKTNRRNS